ncbi:MAG: hypothetical protein ACI9EF_001497 [Pseudohongiellaceae bacterium]
MRNPYSCTNPPDGFVDFLDAAAALNPPREQPPRRSGLAAWPWGGLGALIIVLIFQHLVFGPSGPWDWQLSRLQGDLVLDRGMIVDRIELQRALTTPHDQPRVIVVGTSRMEASFREEFVAKSVRPPIDFFMRAHTRLFPHEIASQLDEILAHNSDLVLITLSEMELLSPLKLVPLAWGGQFDALFDLMNRTGPGFVHKNREAFMRMIGTGLLDIYRFRSVVGKTLADRMLHVELRPAPAGKKAAPTSPTWPDVLADGEPFSVPAETYDAVIAALKAQFPQKHSSVSFQTQQIRSIRPGAHAELKMDIMERNIRLLREAGVEVLLFEGVLHPLASSLYDQPGSRQVFLRWAQSMAEQDGVSFLSRDVLGEVPAEEFRDVTHVNKLGAQRITLALMDWCATKLTPQWRDALLDSLSAPPKDS